MHDLIQLRGGEIRSRKNPSTPAGVSFRKDFTLSVARLDAIVDQLRQADEFFSTRDTRLGGALVRVHYHRIVPKSKRIQVLLSGTGNASETIRGACFESYVDAAGRERTAHCFTHFVSFEDLQKSLSLLADVREILVDEFGGTIDAAQVEDVRKGRLDAKHPHFKTRFLNALNDVDLVRLIDVAPRHPDAISERLVTLYRVGEGPRELLARYGIDVSLGNVLDDAQVRLDVSQWNKLNETAPYLIAMSVTDLCRIDVSEVADERERAEENFPHPGNEPTIGVIDTVFDSDAYFHEWVTSETRIAPEIPVGIRDKCHATEVCSLIVDGPALNPSLEDGCGRFRVRHFGVATATPFSTFEIIRQIRQIVAENQDVHVWNLSLGSALEIDANSISPAAAVLDELQRMYDIVFVVAGTNVPKDHEGQADMKVGSPADSLNSLVVNAVDMQGRPASYTRVGPVLSFFRKPDVCYYGGDGETAATGMCVHNGCRKRYAAGTSFAAPWIARKMAFLIEVMHLRREVAKALVVDSAAAWNGQTWSAMCRQGYGVVPKLIQDVLGCRDDEIKFFLTSTADAYETYTDQLPVPQKDGRFSYFARATLAYFPCCDRNQGVDYTMTELDVKIGPVLLKDGKTGVRAIDDNVQDEDGASGVYEEEARKMFRKWDNVKRIAEEVNPRAKPRPSGPSRMWGVHVKSKDRRTSGARDSLAFGLVVTLKEMKGENRYDDFIQMCEQRGWLVNRVSVRNQLDLFAQAEQEVRME